MQKAPEINRGAWFLAVPMVRLMGRQPQLLFVLDRKIINNARLEFGLNSFFLYHYRASLKKPTDRK